MTESMFKPGAIPKQVTLRESAARILLAQIMSGELNEGEIYSVAMVASNFGISPTPVREAVLELADKGLLTVHKNRGFTIPVLTKPMMQEIHHIRFLLEAPSTVRAGMQLNDTDAAELRNIAEMTVEAAKSGDLVNYVELDREFHGRFLSVLEMPLLVRLIMDYRDRARLIGLRARLGSDEIIEAAKEHIALVDAAVARDEAALARIIANHLEMTLKRSLEGC